MRQIVFIMGSVILALALIVGASTFFQANGEELRLSADLQYRTRVLADSLTEAIQPSFAARATTTVQRIVDRIADKDRIAGLGVFDSNGLLVASSTGLPSGLSVSTLVTSAMDSGAPSSAFASSDLGHLYVLVDPLLDDSRVIGALMVVQNGSYIDDAIAKIWTDSLMRLLLQIILVGGILFALVRLFFFKPLSKLVESMRSVRVGGVAQAEDAEQGFLMPLMGEVSRMTTSLQHARFVAGQEARMRLEKLDTPWTAERLKEFVKAYLKDKPIFVVSNREPYIHAKTNGKIQCSVPAHGMVTAVESVMEACGGMWLAHGSGSADKEMSDAEGKIRVPPEEPKYMLKRIWLTGKEVQGHYSGFSNEALFPLCHMSHVRPIFRKEDWVTYRRVNGKFAAALLKEIKDIHQPIILVQDLHFALLPQMIKKSRPDARVGIFWHHPWPSAEQFSICPWRREILEGLLGADVIGFHIQQYSNNFIETVGKEIESLIDRERFAVAHNEHESRVRVFPISIAFTNDKSDAPKEPADRSALERLGIRTEYVGLGVERLDYIKGIMERLKGIEVFFERYPKYRGHFTFLQIAAPTRESVQKYREYAEAVTQEAKRINERFRMDGWKPIVFEHRMYSHKELRPLYMAANFCAVTSLHDGMNLVSKEFVSARDDESGVLILSQFTGSARQLSKGALMVNPYNTEEMAETIHKALLMSPTEQRRRMQAMRSSVRNYNVYRWAAEFLKSVADL